ncbi:MAG: PH domain-containing protein, partial [SAR324 cluster bacterium]|nr:PH domain-containing protein [SAR324 cluster bacterium]
YILDKNGIEGRYGVLWVNQVISRIRYVDIRSAEIQQSLIDRLLTVGDVIISSAAKQTIDILFQGIAVPHEVKEVILAERDKRQRLERLNMKEQSGVKEQAQA